MELGQQRHRSGDAADAESCHQVCYMTTAVLPPIHVIVADDNALVRTGLSAMLSHVGDVRILAEARDGNELLVLLRSVRPDLIVTDINMPGLDGLTAIGKIREFNQSVGILVVSMHDEPETRQSALARGADGFLRKDASFEEFEAAIQAVRQKRLPRPTEMATPVRHEDAADACLTPRQRDVLLLIAQGRSSRQIAAQLGLSSATVDVHRSSIGVRLGFKDVASLTRYALRQGLLAP
jgi:two-component system, NarL family, nitrate/nitrite response regulator NarL